MVQIKSAEEIEIMRQSCLLVGEAHAAAIPFIKEGVTTMQLNKIIEEFIRDNGGVPSFLNYHGYPYATCMSVNEVVVHGFPGDAPLKNGDILSMDIGIYKNGFHGDSAYTYALGEIIPAHAKLIKITKESLYKGIEKARVGNRVGDIGNAIQEYTERKFGYGVVRDLVGHGLGREMHEEPQVPNYGKKGAGMKLKAGMVMAIEPMINLGVKQVDFHSDGWTILTKDRKVSVHFEHDVHVTAGDPDILSSFAPIEAAEKANPNLTWCHD